MYEDKTADVLRDEQLAEVRGDVDKRQGSLAYDMLAAAARGGEVNYVELDTVLALAFAQTSAGYFLELRAAERGVFRKEAEKASGNVTLTGTADLVVPAATRLVTADEPPIYFTTQADVTLTGGTGVVAAEAEEGGAAGNVSAGKIEALAEGENLAGITSVTNSAAFSGGVDTETDEALLDRFLDTVQRPATSGNIYHYEQWATSIVGIADAKVYPIWDGPGTVKVVLLGDDGTAPIADKITEVADYIETQRPIGAAVTVQGAGELLVSVAATLTLQSGFDLPAVTDEFELALASYLREIAFTDEPVRYSRIAAILLETDGVEDYEGLTVNSGTANVVIPDGTVAVKGAVSLV